MADHGASGVTYTGIHVLSGPFGAAALTPVAFGAVGVFYTGVPALSGPFTAKPLTPVNFGEPGKPMHCPW